MTMTTEDTTTQAERRAAYVEKVRKLLAKAEGASTEAEAETFFAKAQELITKWEMDDAELRPASSAGWVITSRVYTLSSYSPNQDSYAMQMVAKGMGLRAYQTPYVRGVSAATTVVFGTDEDLDRFDMMWTSVLLQMTRAMKAAEPGPRDRNAQRRFRLGFKVGYGDRIGKRLEAQRSKTTGKSLVLVGKSEAIERALPDDVTSKRMRADADALDAGQAAADKADLGGTRIKGGSAGQLVNA